MIRALLVAVGLAAVAPYAAIAASSANLDISVTPPVAPTIPPGAAAAGFTSHVFHWDATQGIDLGCAGDTGAHQWYQGGPPGYVIQSPCSDVAIVQDQYGPALDLKWDPNTKGPSGNWYGANAISTMNFSQFSNRMDFGNYYVEAKFRVTCSPMSTYGGLPSCAGGLWWNLWGWWPPTATGVFTPVGIEADTMEGHPQRPTSVSSGCIGWGGIGCSGNAYIGAGSAFDYSKPQVYGARRTSDGATKVSYCGYLNGNFMGTGCATSDGSGHPEAFTNRTYPIVSMGWGCVTNGSGNCQNNVLKNVYSAGGADGNQIAFTVTPTQFACGLQYETDNEQATFSGITGVTDAVYGDVVNTTWHIRPKAGQVAPCFTDWVMSGSTFSGSWAGGGTLNPYTRADLLLYSVDVYECPSGRTTMCNGTALTNAP